MTRYSLVIADADTSFTSALKHYISRIPDFDVVGTASDGLSALELVRSKKPDLLLTDLMLPVLDGLCLLKETQKMRNPPITLCLSSFHSSSSIESMRKNGVSYYIFKPIEFSSLVSILREHADLLARKRSAEENERHTYRENSLAKNIYGILHSLGFSSKYAGSGYIVESVIMAYESPLLLRNLTHDLYQELAARIQISPSCIERSMRTAIAAANQNGKLQSILGQKPTNKRFIQYLLDELKSRGY